MQLINYTKKYTQTEIMHPWYFQRIASLSYLPVINFFKNCHRA